MGKEKQIRVYDKRRGTITVFNSIQEASKETLLTHVHIGRLLKKESKFYKVEQIIK